MAWSFETAGVRFWLCRVRVRMQDAYRQRTWVDQRTCIMYSSVHSEKNESSARPFSASFQYLSIKCLDFATTACSERKMVLLSSSRSFRIRPLVFRHDQECVWKARHGVSHDKIQIDRVIYKHHLHQWGMCRSQLFSFPNPLPYVSSVFYSM